MKVFITNLLLIASMLPINSWGEDRTFHAGERVDLSSDTVWVYDNVYFQKDTLIVTNGNALSLTVLDSLTAEDPAEIVSFHNEHAPALGINGADGQNGHSWDPGPGTSGAGPSVPGRNGGDGADGQKGQEGRHGITPGPINIVVIGEAKGILLISNHGSKAGKGGNGGNGGNGGSGEQGGRATPNKLALGIVAGCRSGPGQGGNGGNGGSAGAGGRGGNAGNGGAISFASVSESANFQLTTNINPGMPGQGGISGKPGIGGKPGYGGRGARGCEGRVNERMGVPGMRGMPAPNGELGDTGSAGLVQVRGTFQHNPLTEQGGG